MGDHPRNLVEAVVLNASWEFGPQLVGKIHVFCGDMDNYYLNLAVYKPEDFLKKTNPAYGGSFEYGRPLKGHGWNPMEPAEMVRTMADHINKNTPAGGDNSWKY